jgi:hypothetical protein
MTSIIEVISCEALVRKRGTNFDPKIARVAAIIIAVVASKAILPPDAWQLVHKEIGSCRQDQTFAGEDVNDRLWVAFCRRRLPDRAVALCQLLLGICHPTKEVSHNFGPKHTLNQAVR